MANLIPSIPVTLDRERHLLFDLNANIAFQEATGMSLIEAMADISREQQNAERENRAPKMPSLAVIRALLWAGLMAETLDEKGRETDDTLSLHQVGAMLDLGGLMKVMGQIGEAFAVGMKGIPAGNPGKAPGKQNGGNRSRSNGRGSGASRK
jgi:hypothetical protein